jgi:hypothetical protein
MRKSINRLVFIIGWLLSPLTFWNDLFINIPVAYFTSSLLRRFFNWDFALLVIVCYWASNIVGVIMMYLSGKNIIKQGGSIPREIAILLGAMIAYSVILVLIAKTGILKPL